MQIVTGSFHETNYDLIKPYLKDKEICIRDSSNNKLYARTYNYINHGICEINDRLLPIIYHDEFINGKHFISYKFLE